MKSLIRPYLFLILTATLVGTGCKSHEVAQSGVSSKTKVLDEKDQLTVTRLFYSAAKEKVLGNLDIAVNLYNQCLRIDPANHAVMYELATVFNNTGRYEDALGFARKAVSLDPQNKWYQLLLAKVCMNNRLYEDAISVYRRLLKDDPENLEYVYELAAVQITAGKLEAAIKTYQEVEDRMGLDEDLIVQKERLYLRMGKVTEAVAEINKLIQSNPAEGRYYGMLAELYFANDMEEEALKAFLKLKEVDPENPIVHFSLADYYRSIGQDDKSFEELKAGFQQENANIDTKIKILLSYYSISETYPALTGQAMELCDIMVRTHPNEPKAFAMYGDFLYRENKLEEARDAFRKAISLDHEKFAVWKQLLIIESELEDFPAMAEESQKALELFPTQGLIYLLNGLANIQTKDFKKAVDVLNAGLDFAQDDAVVKGQFFTNLGDAYHGLNQHRESDGAYEKALTLEPRNAYVLNNYSYYLSLRGDSLNKAARMAEKATVIEPNNASFLDTYGWVMFRLEKYEEAEKWIKKAMELSDKDRPTILEHYGDILFKLGRTEEALEYWHKARAIGLPSQLLEKKINDRRYYDQ
ncbi:MAG: tetratricopeptide repeat protein [Flavobacteriales bacterium]|nr:tetratricopeptide repeat protein [Flavobacteriales bacterium]